MTLRDHLRAVPFCLALGVFGMLAAHCGHEAQNARLAKTSRPSIYVIDAGRPR